MRLSPKSSSRLFLDKVGARLINPKTAQPSAWYMVGVATMMAIWWVSEVVPIPVTSLLPMILVPLPGIASIKEVTAPYAHPTIYLFFGGFMLGQADPLWLPTVHRREP
ncbi:SLC13 family permease [Endozoicomonas sp. ALE010]|uniref:SLC13 family permease n=1 Tax=Endozoicomonas sp. ALE010 TaxID=3403081 RepID=UPI003BB766F3